MDTIPVYGLESSQNGTTVLPGKESFQKYNILQLCTMGDYALIKKDHLAAFIGGGIIIGGTAIDYTYHLATVEDESYSGGGILGGFRFHVGTEYAINDNVSMFLSANRSYFLVTEPKAYESANDYDLGMIYEF